MIRPAPHGVDHNKQLHKIVVYGLAGGLNKENIAAADGLINGNRALAVCKALALALAQFLAKALADALAEGNIGITGENLHFSSVSKHNAITSLFILVVILFKALFGS